MMTKMRLVKFFILLAITLSLSAPAFGQQDAAFFKQKAEECLSRGECDKAQIMYDTWKQVSGLRDGGIEARIAACKTAQRMGAQNTPTQLQIGQEHTVRVGGHTISGRIAYLDATKQHGLMLVHKDSDPSIVSGRVHYGDPWKRLPTKAELALIYSNRTILGLHNEYWSQTTEGKYHHYTQDFATGKNHSRRTDNVNGWGTPNYYRCHKIYVAYF